MMKRDRLFQRTHMAVLLVGTLSATSALAAGQNPFAFTDLGNGYSVAQSDNEGDKAKKEGSCGGKAASEAVCGMYQVGSSHKDPSKVKEGKCGGHKIVEASCGGDR